MLRRSLSQTGPARSSSRDFPWAGICGGPIPMLTATGTASSTPMKSGSAWCLPLWGLPFRLKVQVSPSRRGGGGGRRAAHDDGQHLVEVARAHLALVLGRRVAVRLARQLLLLQAHIGGHAFGPVRVSELERPQPNHVPAGERDELEFVAQAPQLL